MGTGRVLIAIERHEKKVTAVTFSPDGERLASASDDRTVWPWDTHSGREILTLAGHAGGITSVAFSPDGHCLASAGWDGAVIVWHGTPLARE